MSDAGNDPVAKEKMTLIVFTGDLDKVLASFVLSTAGASMGMDVTMFFTFWGLNVLKKNPPFMKGSGIMEKMLSVLNRGGANRLPLSKLNMFGMGRWMLGKMMKSKNVLSVQEFLQLAIDLKVKLVACEMSMTVMGIKMEDLINEVDSEVGAISYLSNAKDAKINLFIS